ncbi:DUF6261 family protein [Bacteroides sp. OttesenSCG-928-J23]|nr:DUF6261 family protein [Bacteroides sp. OttesenSCG-928-J23]MDL2303788.1 DUF6261 family protein [Bacteroides sp. OttesenSCG-928-D19]
MNNQIKTFAMSHLLIGAHYDYHNSIYTYIREATPVALHIEALATEYADLLAKQLKLINLNLKVPFTEELATLDYERGRWMAQLFNTIDVAASSLDTSINAAGKRMKNLIAPYRGISGNEYTKETSQIRGLLRDMGATNETMDDVELLNIVVPYQELRKANNRFADKYDERVTVEATREHSDVNSVENRKIIDNVYQEIVTTVNAFAIAVPTDALNSFVNMVNARISLAKGVITRQKAGGTGNEKIKSKLQKAADKMGKALSRMEVSKAKYEADLAAYELAKKEYEELPNA